MIALCREHADAADAGNWTKEELHQFKSTAVGQDVIRKSFLWCERSLLYRLGGCYAGPHPTLLSLAGQRVLWEQRSPDGRVLISLDLMSPEGTLLLQMRDNSLDAQVSRIHDLRINIGATHVKLWLQERKIGLELKLRHLPMSELGALLDRDAEASQKKVEALVKKRCLPEEMLRTGPEDDWMKGPIMDYAEAECLNSDGKVPVLDISNATLHAGGHRLVVRNGLSATSQLVFSFSCDNTGAAFSL